MYDFSENKFSLSYVAKSTNIKLGGAPYEDATQASIHYRTPALLKVMFRITTRIV